MTRAATKAASAVRALGRAAVGTRRSLRVPTAVERTGFIGFDGTEALLLRQSLGAKPQGVEDDADRRQGHRGGGDHG